MAQAYASAASSFQLPLQPSPSGTPTITPTQADYDKGHIRTPNVEPRYRRGLRSQHDDVDLIWEREQQRLKEREATQDKFATLFEPPTPRASPTLLSSSLPPASATVTNLPLFYQSRQTALRNHTPRPNSISSSSGSDFGSFVKATEDPLSLTPAHERPVESKSIGGDATPSTTNAAAPALSSPKIDRAFLRRPLQSQHHSNATLEFFDMFTHDAKQRSSATRSQLLDELLLHEDDPMWFVLKGKNEEGDTNNDQVDQVDPPSPPHEISDPATIDLSSQFSKDSYGDEKRTSSKSIFLDIDHDYFRHSPATSSQVSPRSLSPIRHRMPSRSNSIPPPAIAPPVACQLTASPPARHYLELVDDGRIKTPLTPTQEEADSSIQTQALGPESSSFSTLSSKLMSSLLRGTHPSPPSSSSPNLGGTQSFSEATGDHTEGNSATHHLALSDDGSGQAPHTSMPQVAGGPASKQRMPFAPAVVTHSISPFAATFYSPPSGAPGFKGDRYDWDKGFSDELEFQGSSLSSADNGPDHSSRISGSWGAGFGFGFGSVRAKKSESSVSSPSSSVLMKDSELNGCGRETRNIMPSGTADWQDQGSGFNRHDRYASSPSSTGSVGGMGDLIEKKAGTIELVGRKPSSDSVLMPELASLLRGHLPALSRLPRSWTLVYSLDQHGISLNTLYSRCEAHLSRKLTPGDLGISKGMLLAITDGAAKEEHRAIFGAWIAEGLKLNKGKGYSGGGESFLWKYVDGNLKIFKSTGKNKYIALCEPDYLSFGGGDGHYGLYLDDTLFEGSSASCPTFDNEPLCTGHALGNLKTVKFECLGLEVWSMA